MAISGLMQPSVALRRLLEARGSRTEEMMTLGCRTLGLMLCFVFVLGVGTSTASAGWESCTVRGTEGDDWRLEGTDGRDVICGLGGDDKLIGLGGNDILRGGDGDDILIAGEGDDLLIGARGEDQLYGRDGRDRLLGGLHDDILEADDGSDVANGGRGSDSLYGTDGTDILRGGRGDEHCMWTRDETSNDVVFGGPGTDRGFIDVSDVERSLERHVDCWG